MLTTTTDFDRSHLEKLNKLKGEFGISLEQDENVEVLEKEVEVLTKKIKVLKLKKQVKQLQDQVRALEQPWTTPFYPAQPLITWGSGVTLLRNCAN